MFIDIYISSIYNPFNNTDTFNKIYSSLPDYRKAKIDRLRFQKDKCLSLTAGYLLQKSMLDLGYSGADKNIITAKHGKPYFRDFENIFFNISHSENYAMCAVSDAEIGCDIQFIENSAEYPIKKMLSPSEYDEIIHSADSKDAFFELWALKEAFLKCIGDGFSASGENFCVSLKNGICQTPSNDNFAPFRLDMPDGYKGFCVAKNYTGDIPTLHYLQI